MNKSFFKASTLLISLGLISACASITSNELPPSEGLVQVKDWNIDQVWVKPGFAPADYSNIMINGRGVEFRTVEDRYTPYNRSSTAYPVSESQQEKLKQIMIDEFSKELQSVEGYGFSTTPSDDTIALDIKLVDVVSNVPSIKAGRNEVYLSEVGRATLVLNFTDSVTGEALVSVIDRRSAESFDGLGFKESTPANNWAAVKQLAKHWAKKLRTGLDEMKQSPSNTK